MVKLSVSEKRVRQTAQLKSMHVKLEYVVYWARVHKSNIYVCWASKSTNGKSFEDGKNTVSTFLTEANFALLTQSKKYSVFGF